MPVRKDRTVRDVGQRFRPDDPRTGAYAMNERPPEYKHAPPEERDYTRGRVENATLNHDLRYFQAVAAGEQEPEQGKRPCLVLNFFRATQTHIKPIAERFSLGQAAGAPYYALHAAPHATSSNEFNHLMIKRRDPISAVYSEACASVIQPRLNLHSAGGRVVATMTSRGVPYNVTWGDFSAVGVLGRCYCVWDGQNGAAIAQVYADEKWLSLNTQPCRGIVKIKRAKMLDQSHDGKSSYENPRDAGTESLGYLDFQREVAQFVSENETAHKYMDIIMGGLCTMMILETRKQDEIAELGSLPAYRE